MESASLIAIQAFDRDGVILFWNSGSEKFFGYGAEEAIGRRVQDILLSSPEVEEFEKQLGEVCATGKGPESGEWPVRSKEGGKLWLLSTLLPVFQGGKVEYVFCIDVDLTERKMVQESLKASEQRFQEIVGIVSDWIWEVDEKGVYTYCSDNVQHILGYSAEEITGKTPFDFMAESEIARVGALFAGIVAEKKKICGLINWKLAKDGRRVCLQTDGVALLDGEGNLVGYRGVDKDVTSREVAEERLREKMTELERFTRVAVDRELKMVELKERIGELEARLKARDRLVGGGSGN
jgi:two-component system, sensor histidine kinase and response regulator